MKKKYFVVLPDEISASYCVDVLLESGLKPNNLNIISANKSSLLNLKEASIVTKTRLISGLTWGIIWGILVGLGVSILIWFAPPPSLALTMQSIFLVSIGICALIGSGFALIIFTRSQKEFYNRHYFDILRGKVMLIITTPIFQLKMIEELIKRVAPHSASGIIQNGL